MMLRAACISCAMVALLVTSGCVNGDWARQSRNRTNNPPITRPPAGKPPQAVPVGSNSNSNSGQPVVAIAPKPVSSEFSRNDDDRIANARHVKTLQVRCGSGSLRIEGAKRPSLDVKAWVYAWAESATEAERLNREINVQLLSAETDNPSVIVSDPRTAHSGQRFEVNLTIQLPQHVRVKVIDGPGNIEVSGLTHGIEVSNEAGTVEIWDVGGGIELTNRGGATTIESASGKINVVDQGSDLTISQIAGEVKVRDAGGKLSIQHVTGTVIASGNQQGIELINIDGQAKLYGIDPSKSKLQGVANLSFEAAQ
ncbi:MAG: hypothetical protein AAF581_20910 [Planctomycetota bacterium]